MSIYQTEFHGGLPARAVEWIAEAGVDTLYAPEYLYDDPRWTLLRTARRNGVRVVVHAMPELAPWATTAPMFDASAPRPELAIPTTWRAETLPGARLLPVPVARDRLPYRQRTNVGHLLHITGAAMEDRNGSHILFNALPFTSHPFRLTVRISARWMKASRISNVNEISVPKHVDVRWVTDDEAVTNYWDVYDDDVDLFVMPRRYAGLSLPIQECASLGIPTLALDCDPYHRANGGFVSGINTTRSRDVTMKGGMVRVFDASPRALAFAIDCAIEDSERHARQSAAADRWAAAHSWDSSLGDEWCEFLQADCDVREEAA